MDEASVSSQRWQSLEDLGSHSSHGTSASQQAGVGLGCSNGKGLVDVVRTGRAGDRWTMLLYGTVDSLESFFCQLKDDTMTLFACFEE